MEPRKMQVSSASCLPGSSIEIALAYAITFSPSQITIYFNFCSICYVPSISRCIAKVIPRKAKINSNLGRRKYIETTKTCHKGSFVRDVELPLWHFGTKI